MLTGLHAQENQARRLLNDLARFRAELERGGGRPLPERSPSHRWLAEVFEPAIAAVPAELWGKREAAEVFHEIARAPLVPLAGGAARTSACCRRSRRYVEDVLQPRARTSGAVLEPARRRPPTNRSRSDAS